MHTVRVVRIGIILCDSTQPMLDPNVILPACFLHDIHRYGDSEPGAVFTLNEHPKLAADFIRRLGASGGLNGYVDKIAAAVESHTGRWGRILPKTGEEWAVHYADNIAANYLVI